MHEQRGSFQGIDTCDITSVGYFSFPSILLDESQLRTIINIPDINVLLKKLQSEKFLTANAISAMRERAKELHPDPTFLKPCYGGSL